MSRCGISKPCPMSSNEVFCTHNHSIRILLEYTQSNSFMYRRKQCFTQNQNELYWPGMLSTFFLFFIHNITSKKNKKKTTDTYSISQSPVKGRERGKDKKNTKVTPLYSHVYQRESTAKHQ